MFTPDLALAASTGGELARGLTVFGITAAVLILGAFVLALALLFRRRDGARPSAASGLTALTTRSNVLLVRADEAVTAGENELGFAIAQFGEERTREFATTVASARTRLSAAFALRHQLDDSFPESVQRQREWTLQIAALSETIVDELAGQDRNFSTLRSDEAEAPLRLATLRTSISTARARLEPSAATLADLERQYDAPLTSPYINAVRDAAAQLDAATTAADAAETQLSPSGVNAVAEHLRTAEDRLHRATRLLDGIDDRSRELSAATVALGELLATVRDDSTEAREAAATTRDPHSGAEVLAAVGVLEGAATSFGTDIRNPIDALDTIGTAVAGLDAALASARNQQARLDHASAALAGTLVSARSQISAIRAFIAVGGRRVGADARTRLAEAERELVVAEAGADPVEALDAARRAVTHARDADALARYDAQHG